MSSASGLSERQTGANPNAPYYPALDGFRAAAILLVFFGHYSPHLDVGWMGVDAFFVLSGFLITGILIKSVSKPQALKRFYVRRTLRIFPLYYAFWLGLIVAGLVIDVEWNTLNLLWPIYLGNWIPVFSVVGRNDPTAVHLAISYHGHRSLLLIDHFWSLCMEEQFYLLWPLLVIKVAKRLRTVLWICLLAVVTLPLFRIALIRVVSNHFVDSGAFGSITFLRFDEFLVGGAAAVLLQGPKAAQFTRYGTPLFASGIALLAFIWSYGHWVLSLNRDILIQRSWVLSYGVSIVDMTALGLILSCIHEQSLLSRLLAISPLRYLGQISYGFYVLHDIPHRLYERLLPNSRWGVTLLAFAATLLLASLSYNLIELPFLRLKTRFEE